MKKFRKYSLLLLMLTYGLVHAGIPQSPKAQSELQVIEKALQWKQVALQEYLKTSKEPQLLQDKVAEMYKHHYLGIHKHPDYNHVRYEQLWEELNKHKITHPFVQGLLGLAGSRQANKRNSNVCNAMRVNACNSLQKRQDLPATTIWLVAAQLYKAINNNPRINAQNRWRQRELVNTILKGLHVVKGEYQHSYVRSLELVFKDLQWDCSLYFHNQAQERKDLTPWLKAVIGGMYHYKRAWERRGPGYAQEVRNDRHWQDFRYNLRLSREYFIKAWKLNPDARIAKKMISISLQLGNNEERQWFDRAVSLRFCFAEAYEVYLRALGSRWGGSSDKRLAFGMECFETARFDTRVPLYLFEAVLRSSNGDCATFIHKNKLYTKLKELFLKTAKNKDYKDKDFPLSWVKSMAVALAISQNKMDDALGIMEGADFVPDPSTFRNFSLEMKFDYPAIFARAYSGPFAPLVDELRRSLKQNKKRTIQDLQLLLEQIGEASKVCSDARGKDFYKQCRIFLQDELDFKQNKWVDIKFDPKKENFFQYYGSSNSWQYRNKNSIDLILVNSSSQLYINDSWRFSGPLEIEVEVDELEVSGRYKYLQAGIATGDSINSPYRDPRGVFAYANPVRNSYFLQNARQRVRSMKGKLPRKNKINLKVWPDSCHMQVGPYVHIGHSSLFKTLKLGNIGIGTFQGGKYSGKLRFSNWKIRRIPLASPTQSKGIKEKIEHYHKRLEFDAEDTLAIVDLAGNYCDIGSYKKSIRYAKLYLNKKGRVFAWLAHYILGYSRMQLGQPEQVEQHLKISIKLNQQTISKQLLAEFLLRYRDKKYRKTDEGIKLVKELLKTKPNSTFYHYLMAAGQAEKAQFKEALISIQKAKKLNKNDDFLKKIITAEAAYKKNQVDYNIIQESKEGAQ